jgi:hypothetical protein
MPTQKLARPGAYHRAMPRRGDPELIYRAQRAGIFNRLRDAEKLDEERAEDLIAQWEREAEATGRERGSMGYWDEAWRWIKAERSRR